jgi:hypothetical protein
MIRLTTVYHANFIKGVPLNPSISFLAETENDKFLSESISTLYFI